MTCIRSTFRPHERLNDPAAFRRVFERRKSASAAGRPAESVQTRLCVFGVSVVCFFVRLRVLRDFVVVFCIVWSASFQMPAILL